MKNKLQKEILKYQLERGWDNLDPQNIAKSISIEASELLENWQWNNKNKQEVLQDTEMFQNVKDELGDVLIYCIEMAIAFNLDFEKIVREKLDKVKKKYTVEAVKKVAEIRKR